MKQPNKEGLEILDELVNVIVFPEKFSEKSKRLLVSIIQIIKERMTVANDELFIAEITKAEYDKYLKRIFSDHSVGSLSAKLQKEYEGDNNEISWFYKIWKYKK